MIDVRFSMPHMAYLVYRYDVLSDNTRRYWDASGGAKVPDKNNIPFWMMLDPDDARELVAKLVEADVKPPTHSFVEGELIATKKHLEDMRQLALLIPPKKEED
jgi:hypothetical protein